MSAWNRVSDKRRSKHHQHRRYSQAAICHTGKEQTIRFLSSFKTKSCPKQNIRHDYRQCEYYHSDKDFRRNPYAQFYLPDDEDLKSSSERVYHPINYLTELCSNPQSCPFGKYCAKAHDLSQLRKGTTQDYMKHGNNMESVAKKATIKSLGTYLPGNHHPTPSNSLKWIAPINTLIEPSNSGYFLPLPRDSRSWFLINSSRDFFVFLQQEAMKEGLCQLEIRNNHWGDGEYGLAIRGSRFARENAAAAIVPHLFDPHPRFFIQGSKLLSTRVIEKLREKSTVGLYEMILGKFSKRAFIDLADQEIHICACNNPSNTGKQIISNVFEKLSFWVKQEGLDKFVDCCCCMDSFNLDEGVHCPNKHFYCGGSGGGGGHGTCIGMLVKEQLSRIQHQGNAIICSICQADIDTRFLAPVLSKEQWHTLEEVRIDNQVTSKVEKLSHEFDKRLETKIQEFINEYGSMNGKVKHEAKMLAKKAQDDILNLKCPHCKAPYAEFSGCMALQCGTCKKYFCGYCHRRTDTGAGAHDHVRQCLANETNNGSYFATPEQIEVAQRKHRIRELKQFLQPLKKDIQNATILELEQDLKDHDIQKAALFEFGNLMRELEEV